MGFLSQSEVCETDEPSTCSAVLGGPSDVFLENRDDGFIAKVKDGVSASDLKDFRPEFAYAYEACSKRTGTALMHSGTEVTNQWCQALGCNYKQCVQMRWECDRDKGENKHAEADIQCVAAATQSSMHPGHFVAFLAAVVMSMLMCTAGCVSGESNGRSSEERQMSIVPKPRSQEGF